MNSPAVASRRPVESRTASATPLSDRAATRVSARAAANDDAARSPIDIFKDPLWMIAIAMGIFFGVAALILALG
jgi:hypothetical protein